MKRNILFILSLMLMGFEAIAQNPNQPNSEESSSDIIGKEAQILQNPNDSAYANNIEKIRWYYIGKITAANLSEDWEMLKEWTLKGLKFIEIAEPDSTQHAHFHFNAGNAYYHLKQPENAILNYQSARKIYKTVLEKEKSPRTREVLEKYLTLSSLGAAKTHYELEEYDRAANYEIVLFDPIGEPVFAPMIYWPDELYEVYKLIQIKQSIGEYKIAFEKSNEGLAFAEDVYGIEHDAYAYFLYTRGLSSILLGDYQNGINDYLSSLIIAQTKTKNSYLHLTVLSRLGNAYKLSGKLERANDTYQHYFERATNEDPSYFPTRSQFGHFLILSGKYDRAIKILEENLIAIEGQFGLSKSLRLQTLVFLGWGYQIIEKYDISEKHYQEALKATSSDTELALVKNNLGLLYTAMGNFNGAEKALLETKNIYDELNQKETINYANTLNNLGSLFERLGNFHQADSMYSDAVLILENKVGPSHYQYGMLINNLAGLKFLQNNFEQADSLYKKALFIIENSLGITHPNNLAIQFNIAKVARELGHNKQAKDLALLIQKQLEEKNQGKSNLFVNTLGLLGLIAMDSSSYKDAANYFEKSLNILEELNQQKGLSHILFTSYLGLCLQYEENLKDATPVYSAFGQSLLSEIKDVFPSMSEEQRTSFIATIRATYDPYFSFSIKQSYSSPEVLSDMLNFRLATKGIIFRSINRTRELIMKSDDQSLKDKYHELMLQKAQLSNHTEGDRQNLEFLENSVRITEKYLSKAARAFEHLEIEEDISWRTLQKKLAPNEAIIETIRLEWYNHASADSVYYAFIIVRPEMAYPKLIVIKDGNALENKRLNQYRNGIKFKMDDLESYTNFWAPLKPTLDGVKQVHFSPDGAYNLLNLNTLRDPITKEYLIDQIDIIQITSPMDLLGFNTEVKSLDQSKKMAFVGFPDYQLGYDQTQSGNTSSSISNSNRAFTENGKITVLPGTKKEIEEIAKILERKKIPSNIYLADDASEQTLASLENPYVLHIATHGFFISENKSSRRLSLSAQHPSTHPLSRSGILLAGAQRAIDSESSETLAMGGDGIFTALEAGGLFLEDTELVVLSACETGLGDVVAGEGVYGLQRSFLTAGASKVIMSLWKVSDQATQALMTNFYGSWAKGLTIREAFRKSQKDLRMEYPEPYNWGAFILLGN